MEESYSLGIAILDFLPNIAFLVGAYFLVRMTLIARGKPCSRMMMAGTLLIFLGGTLKATWKLIYTLEIGNIQWMSDVQFIFHAPGFFAMMVAVVYIARHHSKSLDQGVVAGDCRLEDPAAGGHDHQQSGGAWHSELHLFSETGPPAGILVHLCRFMHAWYGRDGQRD